jgi:protein-serine/threonine kinase
LAYKATGNVAPRWNPHVGVASFRQPKPAQCIKPLRGKHWHDLFDGQTELGKGGSGATVYKTLQRSTNKVIAVKVFTKDGEYSRHVWEEIETLQACRHPHIVGFIDCFSLPDDTLWLLMDFCDGGALEQLSKHAAPVQPQVIGYLTRGILLALDCMHSLGYVHRDLKSQNILMNLSGHVTVADLGIAERLGGDPSEPDSCCRLMGIIGTDLWMAPEVIRGELCGYPMDVWGVGALVFEMVTGAPMYQNLPRLKARFTIATEGAPALPSGQSPHVASFVGACLQLDASERPSVRTLLKHSLLTKPVDASHLKQLMTTAFLQKTLGDVGLF